MAEKKTTPPTTTPADDELQAAMARGDMAEVARLAAQASEVPPAERPIPPVEEALPPLEEPPPLDEDAEFAKIFAEAAEATGGDADEMWATDWSPDQGLHAEGWHPAVFANVDKGATRAGDAAVEWAFTIIESGRTLKRKVNLQNGRGIERINIQFAAAFGIEPVETPAGRQLPGGALKRLVGTKCEVKIEHRDHWEDKTRKIEDVAAVRPLQTGVDLG